jgi:hypothetical protein
VDNLATQAEDHYMGCWINGKDRALVLWLLEECIPCFIVHILDEHDLKTFRHSDTTFLTGFITQTEVEGLSEAQNKYESITKNT